MIRPRRLRRTASLRSLVQEVKVSPSSLIYPVFVKEGHNICEEISAMPGQFHLSPDRLPFLFDKIAQAGVSSVLFFGLPSSKDETGSGAWADDGVVQQGLRAVRQNFPHMTLITDVCLCEYTSHGHCGMVKRDGCDCWTVDNDSTLPLLARAALSHVEAGADVVAPSDMMDRRVAALRHALDESGFDDRAVFSYAVKYSSAFYGPFRVAVESAPAFGDRRSYQMDPHNGREALLEAELDELEGADALIVKPGLPYLDVLSQVVQQSHRPVGAYWVSGEYSMIKAAAAKGWIDGKAVTCESALAFFRAGAQMLITYSALELAQWMGDGTFQ